MTNTKEEQQNMETEEDIETRGYELAYLLLPGIQEDKLDEEVGKIKGFIEEAGGEPASEKSPKRIDLSYTMSVQIKGRKQRFDEAYFGWVRFEAPSAAIAEIHENLREEEGILRFMVVLIDKESLVSTKRDEAKEEASQSRPTKENSSSEASAEKSTEDTKAGEEKETKVAEESQEASEEEIDKTIDEMVEDGANISDNKATSNT